MVSNGVLLTVILSFHALLGGAFYSLVAVMSRRLDRVEERMERIEARMDERFDRLESDVAGLKAAVALLEARLEH
jgi:sensor domain CHASE-containing protein